MCPCLLSFVYLVTTRVSKTRVRSLVLYEIFLFSRVSRYVFAVTYRRFQYVNVLFPVIVVPGRVELPTSTLSV